MGYPLREISGERKFSQELDVAALESVVPRETVGAVLAAHGAAGLRERKLNLAVTVYLVIAMNLYMQLSLGHVLRKLAQGLRFVWPEPEYQLPSEPAVS